MALLLGGFAILLTGILFLVAPASLHDAGFRRDGTLVIKVAGLLAFGGVGLLFAWNAWGLIRLRAFSFDFARAVALGIAWLAVTRIVGGGSSVFDWLALVGAGAMAGYLTLPSVRALLRPMMTGK